MVNRECTAAPPLMEAFKPTPALAPYVTDIWAWELATPAAGQTTTLTLLPDGHPTMCFVYGAPLVASDGLRAFTTRSAVCGFQARPVHVSCTGAALGLTVRFTPWGLSSVVPGSLEEAAERRIECRDVFDDRPSVEALESELAELPTSLARVRRVESFLLARLRADRADRLVQALVGALAIGRRQRIQDVVRDFGASDRTVERRFRHAVGVAPKLFARVLRLQDALRRREQQVAWSELALDAGYCDQSHLIRDARQLFGASPRALAAPADGAIARGFELLGRATSLNSMIFR
jgi:AraC-like DNA-binding protein